MTEHETGNGKNRLFNDSKLGVLVGGLITVVTDGVLDAVVNATTNYNAAEGGWGWGTTIVAAVVGVVAGAATAYKAKREKTRSGGF